MLKTLDTFDFKAQPFIKEQIARELMRGELMDKRENVLLIGNPKTGKTHLDCALALSACAHGRKVLFHNKRSKRRMPRKYNPAQEQPQN